MQWYILHLLFNLENLVTINEGKSLLRIGLYRFYSLLFIISVLRPLWHSYKWVNWEAKGLTYKWSKHSWRNNYSKKPSRSSNSDPLIPQISFYYTISMLCFRTFLKVKKKKELKIECLLSEDILKMRVLKYLSIAIVNEREEQSNLKWCIDCVGLENQWQNKHLSGVHVYFLNLYLFIFWYNFKILQNYKYNTRNFFSLPDSSIFYYFFSIPLYSLSI